MKRLFHGPLAFLLGLSAAVYACLWSLGHLRLREFPDSVSYRIDLLPLEVSLAGERTLGYPSFLKLAGLISPSLELLPTLQGLIHIMAVLVFWQALRRLGLTSWRAALVASTLLFAPLFLSHAQALLTDALAGSLAILTISFLFMIVADPRSRAAWSALVLVTFLTYQVRPAYLFLLGFVPVVGLVLFRLQARGLGGAAPARSMALRLAAGMALPYLGFCTLRWFLVGHFGLVSFGGVNLIGVAGQFLSGQSAQELPARLQPLADRVLQEREATVAQWFQQHTFTREPGEVSGCFAPTGQVRFQYRRMVRLYLTTVDVWRSAAADLGAADGVSLNARLSDASYALLRVHPEFYVKWLMHAFWHGLRNQLGIFLAIAAASVLLYALARIICPKFGIDLASLPEGVSSREASRRALLILTVTAVAFFVCKLALVILVEPPIPRYLNAAGVLLITVPFAFLHYWQDRRPALSPLPMPPSEKAHIRVRSAA